MIEVENVATTPYEGQKPGTSGLRKKVTVFQQEKYLCNFVQAIFDSLPKESYEGQTLLCSGDGRYWNKEAIQMIAQVCAGNKVGKLWIGQHGWMSTPAASAVIRRREGGKCRGCILLTASHNPGGPTEDFGVKFNGADGAPAPEAVTDKIYEATKTMKSFKRVSFANAVDLATMGVQKMTDDFSVEIIDPVEDWLSLMQEIFDFDLLRNLVSASVQKENNENGSSFSFVYDGMNGIAGPYAKKLFVDLLQADPKCLMRCEPLEDFGGCHPDPNLTYAADLVRLMKVFPASESHETESKAPDFGAAGDGDNDRNMILGRNWFVTPSDSVAIIAAYAQKCIPYFKDGLKGVARSMPTSMALKNVATALGISHFEVPTGWKFFGNLMEAGKCNICGEESFGTGSDHIREKDGLWAVLAWLSILAYERKSKGQSVSVKEINETFWAQYGRNYYTRYDYENVDTDAANKVMHHALQLNTSTNMNSTEGTTVEGNMGKTTINYLKSNPIVNVDSFTYADPVDKSVTANQGVRVNFKDGARFVIRLSGTGSSGATIRLYIEKFDKQNIDQAAAKALEPLVAAALDLTRMQHFTGRDKPTVIT